MVDIERQDLSVLQGQPAPERRGSERTARHGSGPVPRCRHPASQIRLSRSRGRGDAAGDPTWLIEGGLPTEATVAQVLVSKYAVPLPADPDHRQSTLSAGRRWQTGLGMPPSICAPCMSTFLRISDRDQSCSPKRGPCRCSISAGAAPRSASSGPMRPMTGRGEALIRPASPTFMRLIARPSGGLG